MLTMRCTSPWGKFIRTRVTKSSCFSGRLIIMGHYSRVHTDLVSGHLTICTQFSTRTCFSPSRASSPFWPPQTEVSILAHSCIQATFKIPFLTLNHDPPRNVLSQNIQSRREKLTSEYQKLPYVYFPPSLSSFPVLMSGEGHVLQGQWLSLTGDTRKWTGHPGAPLSDG